ncbi:hypothetical protein RB195_015197 [Necator americanus]|uniref:Uncharacterized protein n=1 Tax=Necator americanus TaxID=51031 RepID=A0ABR1E3G6_NECAM
MLLRGLRVRAERASKPRTTNLDRISKTTRELLERRRLDPNASHIERLPNRENFVIRIPRAFCEHGKKEELSRKTRAAWATSAAVREATDQLTDQDLRAHLFDSTVLPALYYAVETWADSAATSRKLLTTHRALERCLLKFNRRTQHLAGLRSSDLKEMYRLRDPAEYVSKAKHRWAGPIMRRIDDSWTNRTLEWIPKDAKRPGGRPPTRWGDVFGARMDQLRAQLDTAQGPRQRHSRNLRRSWMVMAREQNEWKRCWCPHAQ